MPRKKICYMVNCYLQHKNDTSHIFIFCFFCFFLLCLVQCYTSQFRCYEVNLLVVMEHDIKNMWTNIFNHIIALLLADTLLVWLAHLVQASPLLPLKWFDVLIRFGPRSTQNCFLLRILRPCFQWMVSTFTVPSWMQWRFVLCPVTRISEFGFFLRF